MAQRETARAPPSDSDHSSDSDSDSADHQAVRPAQKKQENIPDAVDSFLGKLYEAVKDGKVQEIHKLYEEGFNKLSNEYYKTKRWPKAETVDETVSKKESPLFIILYKELYYRHIWSRSGREVQVQASDRQESWENYSKLMDLIVHDLENDDLSMALPAQWLWDILDEFVYHFQTYCAARAKAMKKDEKKGESIEKYRDQKEQGVWETTKVLKYLHQIVKLSRVEDYLKNKEGGTGRAFTDETARLMGYFSLMQLLRMHCLLGDYQLAMKTIQNIDIHEEVPLFYKIPACHVTLYYYMGFSYMMMRRYADAIRTFSDILVFLSKTTGVNQISYQFEAMVKKQEQMYALMMISLTLSPRQIDESLEKCIRDKYGEKQARLQRGEEICFSELFTYACPKFVSASAPDFENPDNHVGEAQERQKELFLQEMRQQQFLPKIGSYMKLYTAIKMTKLAQLCEMETSGLRDSLMCVMHKTSQKVRSKGAPLDGEPKLCSEVEFYLDGDMVHINAQRTEREHADVFLEQILKFQDLLRKMGKA